ncbi:bifunctional riboflavin kinase/FAD synthetase [Xylocopilactobacillus apicola]|uniref:Riboflavin biosynthesis protein n=1 Tax=Xylocopilactobacillus apicola TaxID=2932184 RepID=A0AAU9D4B8_9LACO|nr:bifunctional riboflavin kinase/FAD synthetase [Xylocopilactobacillus apicola]BDR58348.1 riboflavin biosynthesis protein [Xylocopilactobacillus apicola]
MEIIKIKDQDQIKSLSLDPNVMTSGFFDGVHLGHQKLIKRSRELADNLGLPLVVLTFWPYPKQFYVKVDQPYPILTSQEDKYAIFSDLGVDLVLEVVFNSQIQKMSPQVFVDKYLKSAAVKVFIAGADFSYGKHDVANMDLLPQYAQNDFGVKKVSFIEYEGEKVSSSRIRNEIKKNNFEMVKHLLGRPYTVKGKIVTGAQVGRTIGFPTANLDNSANYLIPSDGVYFTRVEIDRNYYWGITSVGDKPTFDGNKRFIETYILDFNQDIYGKKMSLEWLEFERPQIKFESEEQLIRAIEQDEMKMRRYVQTR